MKGDEAVPGKLGEKVGLYSVRDRNPAGGSP